MDFTEGSSCGVVDDYIVFLRERGSLIPSLKGGRVKPSLEMARNRVGLGLRWSMVVVGASVGLRRETCGSFCFWECGDVFDLMRKGLSLMCLSWCD